jgi:hypothetical protein
MDDTKLSSAKFTPVEVLKTLNRRGESAGYNQPHQIRPFSLSLNDLIKLCWVEYTNLAKNWSKRGPLLFPFTKELDIPKASQNVSKIVKGENLEHPKKRRKHIHGKGKEMQLTSGNWVTHKGSNWRMRRKKEELQEPTNITLKENWNTELIFHVEENDREAGGRGGNFYLFTCPYYSNEAGAKQHLHHTNCSFCCTLQPPLMMEDCQFQTSSKGIICSS